jgi:hypothetical protein
MRIALAGGSCNAHPSGTSPRYLVKKTTGWVFQAFGLHFWVYWYGMVFLVYSR